jgi:protoporphyrinogen/coproporphyrinogen III oxidase
MTMHDVVVVGGGIAGLTAAWNLTQAGLDVKVVEEDPAPGGNIKTVGNEDYRMESGPHSFMGSAENVWRLLEELGVDGQAVAADAVSNNRYILRDGKLHTLPTGAWPFISTGLLSCGAKLSLMCEPFKRNRAREEDTAWDFFKRRFGEEAATYIMSPFISGVYAGDIKQLGALAAFPKFWNFEKNSGSMIRGAMKYMKAKRQRLKAEGKPYRKGLFSLPGGLGQITTVLAERLGSAVESGYKADAIVSLPNGVEVRSGDRLWQGRAALLAVPPNRGAEILRESLPDAAAALQQIPMVPVAVLHWRCENPAEELPHGFGFLVPRVEGVRVLGTLFPSQLFGDRAPVGSHLLASFYGGALDREAYEMDDESLTELMRAEHEAAFGVKLQGLRVLRIVRHPYAIPQLIPEHPTTVAKLRHAITAIPGLSLAGNYLTGVGIEQAVESGYLAGTEVQEFLGGAKS